MATTSKLSFEEKVNVIDQMNENNRQLAMRDMGMFTFGSAAQHRRIQAQERYGSLMIAIRREIRPNVFAQFTTKK